MNVFVLCTGRSGSLSFIRACHHILNYSAGHESRSRVVGSERFRYPENHIEADNRLSWFTGALEEQYGNEAFYVHLVRDREHTVRSYNRRWTRNGSLIRAYTEGIHQISLHRLSRRKRLEVVEDLYDRVNENIRHFLKDKENKITIRIENICAEFPLFWRMIGAEGDLGVAMNALKRRHNSSRIHTSRHLRHELKFRLMKLRRRIF